MKTFQEAKKIAEDFANNQNHYIKDSLVIIEDQIIDQGYAWIFSYTSKQFYETKDIQHAIGGNAPIFVSKLDGFTKKYRTGLSIQEMIDTYEEENKLWELVLEKNIFIENSKMFWFKQILGFTSPKLSELKKDFNIAFEKGSRTRLLELQKQLSLKEITTCLTQVF